MQASLPQDAEDEQNSCPVSALNPGYELQDLAGSPHTNAQRIAISSLTLRH
jgi:hypothetical protein